MPTDARAHTPHLRLTLSPTLQAAVEQELLRRCRSAVADHAWRDDYCRDLNAQMNGQTAVSSDNPRWANACDLDDPLTRDGALSIQAQFVQALKRTPLVTAEAVHPEDAKNAETQEDYLAAKFYQARAEEFGADMAYNVLRYPVGIGFVGWAERARKERSVRYRPADDPRALPVAEEDKEPGVEYDTVFLVEPGAVEYAGHELRVVDTPDFYLYPANANAIERANSVWERMLLSADDLLNGIADHGFDKEAVYTLLSHIPSQMERANGVREDEEDRAGVAGVAGSRDGFYEIFVGYTRFPLLRDDDGEMRAGVEDYLQDDFLCVLCPAANLCLRLDFSPYPNFRPYVPFYFLRVPGSFYGLSYCELLDALQAEANANLRLSVDSMNLQIAPVLSVSEEVYQKNDNLEIFPGAKIPRRDPNDIVPLTLPATWREGLAFQQWIEGRATQMWASGGYGQLPTKQRKSAEIAAMQAAASSKLDLFLFMFMQGFERLAELFILLAQLHLSGEESFFDPLDNAAKKISPVQLRGVYNYHCGATSANANPDLKLEHSMAAVNIAKEWATLVTVGAAGKPYAPPILKALYHAYREALLNLHVHNPETYLGPEPSEENLPALPPAMPAPPPPAGGPLPAGFHPMTSGAGITTNGNGHNAPLGAAI